MFSSTSSSDDDDGPEWGALIGLCDTPVVSHTDKLVDFTFSAGPSKLTAAAAAAAAAAGNHKVTIVVEQSLEARNIPGVKPPHEAGGAAAPAATGGASDATATSAAVSECAVTTGAVVWDGSVIAARFLEQNRDYIAELLLAKPTTRLSVLELGAGCCGLVGLVAAALGCNAVVTDCPPAVLAALTRTVESNTAAIRAAVRGTAGSGVARAPDSAAAAGPKLGGLGGSISVKELDWTKWPDWFRNSGGLDFDTASEKGGGGEGEHGMVGKAEARPSRVQSTFDLVVCADCVYDVQLVPALLQTASACLRVGAGGGLVLATVDTAVHRPEALKVFAAHAAEMFHSVELVEPGTAPLRQWEQCSLDCHADSETVKIFLLTNPK